MIEATGLNHYGRSVCPACKKIFDRDPWDPQEGWDEECPHCEAQLTVCDVERCVTWTLAAKTSPLPSLAETVASYCACGDEGRCCGCNPTLSCGTKHTEYCARHGEGS